MGKSAGRDLTLQGIPNYLPTLQGKESKSREQGKDQSPLWPLANPGPRKLQDLLESGLLTLVVQTIKQQQKFLVSEQTDDCITARM